MIKTGDVFNSIGNYEGYKAFSMEKTRTGSLRLASDHIQSTNNTVDVSWLPLAAEQYVISADINDYIICDVPIVHVAIPNRNMDCFDYSEVSKFNPEVGRAVYQSFIGKPTHKDHDNKDIRKAKGVMFDSSLVKNASTNLWEIRILAGFDRTKDESLCNEILSGKRPGHSMGAMVGWTRCSYPNCEATSTTGRLGCSHFEGTIGKGRVINGHLIYELCYNVNYIESSSVGDAANFMAQQQWSKSWK